MTITSNISTVNVTIGNEGIPPGYNPIPIFEDNFNGSILDTTKWMTVSYAPNTTIGNSNAILTATVGTGSGRGAGIRTKTNFSPGCYIEFRAKLTNKVGFSNALWLAGASVWPPELDIVEAGSYPDIYSIYQTIHCSCIRDISCCGSDWKGPTSDRYKQQIPKVAFDKSLDFHTYGAEWTSGYIQFYIDRIPIGSKYTTGVPKVPMWLQAGICPRGVRTGCLPERPYCCYPETKVAVDYPARVYVDYVRVYQKI